MLTKVLLSMNRHCILREEKNMTNYFAAAAVNAESWTAVFFKTFITLNYKASFQDYMANSIK